MLIALLAVAVLAGAVIAAVSLLSRGTTGGGDTFVTDGPWRLRIVDGFTGADPGCVVTVTETTTGTPLPLSARHYGRWTFQVHQAGTFRWTVSDPNCTVSAVDGSGSATLPFDLPADTDSDAFTPPTGGAIHVVARDYRSCTIRLVDPTTGGQIASAPIGQDGVTLDAGGHGTVYVGYSDCAVGIATAG